MKKAGPYLARGKAFARNQAAFAKRFLQGATGEPKPTTDEAVILGSLISERPAMAQWMLWRRALLALCLTALILGTVKAVFFEPHSMRNELHQQTMDNLDKDPASKDKSDAEKKKQADETVDQQVKVFGPGNIRVFEVLSWVSILITLGSLFAVWQAEKSWANLAASKKWALWSLAFVAGPLIIFALIPMESMLDYSHLQPEEKTTVASAFKILFAVMSVVTIAPLLLGVANGIVRGSLVSRNLVPAATLCGWVTLVVAGFLTIAWLLATAMVMQAAEGGVLLIAMLLILAGPLSLLIRWKTLCWQSITPTVVSSLNLTFLGLSYAGIAFAFIYLLRNDLLQFNSVLTVMIHYAANLLLVLVVTVDLMLQFMRKAYPQLHENTPAAVAELSILE